MKSNEIIEPDKLTELRLISLEAENVKRLVAIDIEFKSNLVQICSEDNGQGKTTALDCIWWALEGAKNIQDKPIRKGQKEARIIVTLTDGKQSTIIVTREFKINKKQELTTKLMLSNNDGSEYISTMGSQELLNTFLTSLAFDPLKFATMDSKAQFDTLKAFVPTIDFKAISKANDLDYETRKNINRDAKAERIKAEEIEVPEGAENLKLINEESLIADLEKASTFNSDIAERATNRKALAKEADDKFELSKKTKIEAENKIAKWEEEIKELYFQIQQCKVQSEEISNGALKESEEIKKKLSELKPLPDQINIELVSQQIKEARTNNIGFNQYANVQMYINNAERLEKESDEITIRMEKREQDKREAISKANIPVSNLTFGDECVLLDGQPFEQASEAQKIYAGMQLTVAQNPLLKLVFIRQGSLMSEKTKKIVFDFCKKHDFTCIMETVGVQSKVGNIVVIEDGQIVKVPKKQESL